MSKKNKSETSADVLSYTVNYTPGRKEAWMEFLGGLQDMLRDIRDNDVNPCPADEDDSKECACAKFDAVIDRLEEAKELFA